MLEAVLAAMERTKLTVASILVGVGLVSFIRSMLEALEAPTTTGYFPLDPFTLVHYFLFYLAAYLLLALVLTSFVEKRNAAAAALLAGLPLLWLPPIIDFVVSGGSGFRMTYLFVEPAQLLLAFLTFGGPLSDTGVTIGIRVEFVLALLFVGYYVYRATRSIARGLVAAVSAYIVMFALVALPSILYGVYLLLPGAASIGPVAFLAEALRSSAVDTNALPAVFATTTALVAFELGFNKVLSLLCAVLIAVAAPLLALRLAPGAVGAHFANSRPTRVLNYVALLAIGALAALKAGVLPGWLDVFAGLVLVLSWYAAWMFAVCVNDIADEDIDRISSPERPLISNTLSRASLNESGYAFLTFSLLGAWSVGYYPFIFLLAFTAAYYVYSAPPLRLKRVPGLASALIALASLFTVLAGWFLLATGPHDVLSPLVFAGFVICFALGVNVRDLKDIDGDAAAGIATLPTIISKRFGRQAAFHITGAVLALAFLLTPLFFPVRNLLLAAVPVAVFAYLACIRKPYQEHLVALVCFIFFISSLFLYIDG
ncbi:MAG TPA: UbiA family prenyltransferase [Candidatus Paceibacterota bacterium]|nr:UbiA family prenyltransferase [Candidatus Paceibacterota bacterium]